MSWAVVLVGFAVSAALVRLARSPLELDGILVAIGAWQPGSLDHPQALANSLAAHLRRGRPGYRVVLRDGALDDPADLTLEAGAQTIAIRIQLGLTQPAEARRLSLEMAKARKVWGSVVLVICGETDPVLRYQVEDRLPGREGTSVVRLAFKDLVPRAARRRAA